MKEFISKNNINMIEGVNFNWERQSIYFDRDDPFVYSINLGDIGEMFSISWNHKKLILGISRISFDNDYGMKFYCPTMEEAEYMVLAFAKANNFEIAPLYEKTI